MKRLVRTLLPVCVLTATIAIATSFADAGTLSSAETRTAGGTFAAAAAPADVFIVSTLYRRHAAVADYGLDALRDLITRIDPAVLVLDVTPAELAAREVHDSKVEYREVVFPLLRSNAYRVYAAEPDEPLFSEIVDPVAARRETMQRTDPDRMTAWRTWDAATHDLLAQLWRSAGDVNSPFTDSVMGARHAIEIALFGDADQQDHERWNGWYATVVRRAAIENPGRRILVLVGVQNRHWLMKQLTNDVSMRLVDIRSWLDP